MCTAMHNLSSACPTFRKPVSVSVRSSWVHGTDWVGLARFWRETWSMDVQGLKSRLERARHEHHPRPAARQCASSTFIGVLTNMASVCMCGAGVEVHGVRGALAQRRSAFILTQTPLEPPLPP